MMAFKQLLLTLSLLVVNSVANFLWEDAGYARWSSGCDFPGNDLIDHEAPGYDCGDLCQINLRCTHFTWTNFRRGTCWLKSDNATHSEKYYENKAVPSGPRVVCGFLQTSSWIIDVDAEGIHWAFNCDFPGNDFEKQQMEERYCGPHCQKTPSCTHFTWSKLEDGNGTCYMKTGRVSKGQEVYKPHSICGIPDKATNVPVVEVSERSVSESTTHTHPQENTRVCGSTDTTIISVSTIGATLIVLTGIIILLFLHR